ncbi:MAG: phenylalanine--tRNA ligase subunit beta, partial [Propionibacteriaceae bacterium]|nr:phenylalanine--tRNA ligase subunit beta [Propionibacteriaceae bacterium]
IAGKPNQMPTLVMPDPTLPARILGAEVSIEQVVSILKASGVDVKKTKAGKLTLTPPTWRPDLVDAYDYVEEVGRKIGFDVIEPCMPSAPVGSGYTRDQKMRRAALLAVAQAGFVEVIPLPFIGVDELDRLGLDDQDRRRSLVRVANPLSENQPYLRSTLLPGLFASINRNTSRSISDLALFECGLVFFATDTGPAISPDVTKRPTPEEIGQLFDRLPDQPRHLAGIVTGDWLGASDRTSAEPASWIHVVHLAQSAAQAVGVTLARRSAIHTPWHPGRCAELGVIVDGEFMGVGWAGEIHPRVIQAWDLPERTCAVEINLDELFALAPDLGQIHPLSKHPATKQDVALVVDVDVPASLLEAALREGAGELLESIGLFDVFTGPQIGESKKSLAFNLIFRAPDRTLTEAEASQARDAAVAEAGRRLGAVIRS